MACDFFQHLFSSDHGGVNYEQIFGDACFKFLTAEDCLRLNVDFTEQEVISALKSFHPMKAPRPDGFHAIFNKTYWDIAGPAVLSTVLGCLNGDLDISDLNDTFITLIPKVKRPKIMAEFRPISLCNFLYKLIAKCITNRIKPVLGARVSCGWISKCFCQ